MSADDRATLNDKSATSLVNFSSLPLLGSSAEASYDGTIHRVVRGSLILPSRERVFITLSTVDIVNFLSAAAFGALLLAAALALLLGCTKPETPLTASLPTQAAVAEAPPGAVPLRIAILQDKTGSSLETRTPLLTVQQLRRLSGLCYVRGGEITVGLIRDESNHLFVRLTMEPPPVAPLKAEAHEKNAIALQAARRVAEKEFKAAMAAYRSRYAAWRSSVATRENVFLADAERLITDAPDAKYSDVNGGISRADLFLAEDDALFGAPTHRYLLVISDGIDNVRKPAPTVSSGATVIVINGIGSLGSLADLQPMRFESIDAALNFIASKEASGAIRHTGGGQRGK
jgi:hypothetical protein